jgi:small-conductance mechanosensitive channel
VWTRDPNRHPQIKSDINYRIDKLFRERKIEIPYPTQEFLLKSADGTQAQQLASLINEDKAAERGSHSARLAADRDDSL